MPSFRPHDTHPCRGEPYALYPPSTNRLAPVIKPAPWAGNVGNEVRDLARLGVTLERNVLRSTGSARAVCWVHVGVSRSRLNVVDGYAAWSKIAGYRFCESTLLLQFLRHD